MKKTIVLISGGFDPLHSGHIAYINQARKLGDILVVGLNSDAWLARKKGSAFMPFSERAAILRNTIGVDFVIDFDDSDGSARHAITMCRQSYPQDKIIFANGGDRTHLDIPEMGVDDDNLQFAFGVGGFNKANSSSWILQEWKAPKTERQWGYYRVLHQAPGMKVKELTVEPGKSLSMQRHEKRREYWVVEEGECKVEKEFGALFLRTHETIDIPVGAWHQLSNPFDKPCKIIEIQYGQECVEEDIERK
jgi:cytidyltransferase-like protein